MSCRTNRALTNRAAARQTTPGQAATGDAGNNTLRDLVNALQRLTQQQAPTAPRNAPNLPNRQANANNTSMVVEQFHRYKPPTFNGRATPLAAEEWLRALERIFKYIACLDTRKVSCAVFQLTEDADHWWSHISAPGLRHSNLN